MLQAHSLLWNYLWIAPNILLLALAVSLWKRGTWRQMPAFLAFAIVSAVGDLTVFVADVTPSVSPETFWRIDWAYLLAESLVKFVVIAEVFSRVLSPYASVSRLGRTLIRGFGGAFVLVAILAAALSRGDSTKHLLGGAHLLEQTVFVIELGLILFLFVFTAHFRLSWDRVSFGILLGFGLSACEYLASWAIMTNAAPSARGRTLLDLLNMATHHVCVLIWIYYLLIPKTSEPEPALAGSGGYEPHLEHLKVWNRELERLLQ
jgi:hypothetical protein